MISSLLIQLGLVALVAGVVVTALVRAKKLGDRWDDWGLWPSSGPGVNDQAESLVAIHDRQAELHC